MRWCAAGAVYSDLSDEVVGLLDSGEALVLELVRVVVDVLRVILKFVVLVVEEVVQLDEPRGVHSFSILTTK